MNDKTNIDYINKAGKNLVNIFKYTMVYFLFVAALVFRLFNSALKQKSYADDAYNTEYYYNTDNNADFATSLVESQLLGGLLTVLYIIILLYQVYRAGKNLGRVGQEKGDNKKPNETTAESLKKIYDNR